MSGAAISILLLTEDSGEDGYPTIEALARAVLGLLDPAHNRDAVHLAPVEEELVRKVSQASYWKSEAEEHRNDIRQLCARIAAQLVQRSPAGFVLYHLDGDRPWSKRAEAENPVLFRKRIVKKVRAILESKRKLSGQELESTLKRLFLVMPYYSIESWLYQNTQEAIAILNQHHGGSHVSVFKIWQADRTLLDDIDQPKEKSVTPLGAKYNRRLAERAYPAADVFAAGRSFSECVLSLKNSAPLMQSLAHAR